MNSASDMALLAPVIGALKAYGMRIAIDDFGTGFSSLSHLQRLDVDTLKIDQSFIRGMLNNPGDLAITRSIVSLGRSLGLTVTAEGVENEAQFKSLRDAGCDYYQGFLFSPAIGPDDYEMLVYEPTGARGN
jgi:EAL domain-containing protein (putative c-di-GMP-specific phosphodiesterase class I)